MVQKLNDRGICGTYNYRSECLSYKNSMKEERPVLHCEEFNDSGVKMVIKKQKEAPGTTFTKKEGGDTAKRLDAKGLCINCDDNKVCKYPGFGQDVIFCKEYRLHFRSNRVSRCSHNTFAHLPSFGVKKLIAGWGS